MQSSHRGHVDPRLQPGAAKQPLQGAGGFSAARLTIAGLIFVFSAMVIFGIRTIITEWMAPIAGSAIYVIMVAIICREPLLVRQRARPRSSPPPSPPRPGRWLGVASSPR